MTSIWRSFVPYHVVTDLIQYEGAAPTSREARFQAVALFADVSGFTAMSEALAETGKRGAEELTSILNSYFEPMIALVHSYGGMVGKFGGDAMTVLFHDGDEEQTAVSRRALQCALTMQSRMVQYRQIETSAGAFSLTMKVGMAAGPIFCTSVGDPAVRLEYVIAGTALNRCADAEHRAGKGDVVIHRSVYAALDDVTVVERADGFYLVTGLDRRAPRAPLPKLPPLLPQVIDTIAAYIHPSLVQRLQRQQLSFINEHRKVTMLFVRFTGFDYDNDPTVGRKLQDYMARVIQTVAKYDGYLNKVDMGDKGSKYLVLFGAPIAHEDDEERALRCALELRDLARSALADISCIGVNTGFVYCGQVGSAVRQEYTVMGDAVNLSARLMQAARSGQILVGVPTYRHIHALFVWGEREAIVVKGKSEPVGVYKLKRLRKTAVSHQDGQYVLPMVGRHVELQRIHDRFTRVLQGQGQIIGVTAEAGMGKTRLRVEASQAISREAHCVIGECQSYGTNVNYLGWRAIWRDLFALDPQARVEAQVQQLRTLLAGIDPALEPRLPLLGTLLNIPIPDNDLTRSLDARLRKESLESLLVDCLASMAQEQPLCLVLEDSHWLDPLSNELLQVIGRNIAEIPVLLLVVYRPPETERFQPDVYRFPHFTEIRLQAFSNEEARQLIEHKLAQLFGQEVAPASLVEPVTARAQGNPFYLDEMLNLIHDRGIDPADPQALVEIELPDSLHSLIISRIDRLAEGPKTTLKVASVIGRLFKASWLWGSYPQLGPPQQVKAHLDELSRLELTPQDKAEPELEYLFKHIVTREVAYESLAVATRSMLHEQIGAYIETHYADELERYLDLLAYHYGQSKNQAKQRVYFAQAADYAQNTYANDVAIEYYRRLLPLLAASKKGDVLIKLGEVLQLVGEWQEAETLYQEALALAQQRDEQEAIARSRHKTGALLRARGAYEDALAQLEQARLAAQEAGATSHTPKIMREMGIIYWYQGNYDWALAYFQECRRIAESIGDRKGLYRAIGNMGLVHWTQGDFATALDYFERSLQIADELNDRFGLSLTYGNMGNVYLDQGDHTQALDHYTRNLQIAQELGYRQGVSISVGNIGNVYWSQGAYDQALACHAYNLTVALELGDRQGVGFSLGNVAACLMSLDHLERAQRYLDRAIALGRALDNPYDLSSYLFSQVNLLAAQEEYEAALHYNEEALQMAQAGERENVVFEAQVAQIQLSVTAGKLAVETAESRLEQMLEACETMAQRAALHYELWKLGTETAESHRQEAIRLYRQLYTETPEQEYRHRYEEMAGRQLSITPSLPPLPPLITKQKVDLERQLAQVDALVAEVEADDSHGHHH